MNHCRKYKTIGFCTTKKQQNVDIILFLMSEEENSILEWVKSFPQVKPEEATTYKMLTNCFAIYQILNFVSDGKIKTDELKPQKNDGDWITCMKNIKALYSALEKEFAEKNIKIVVEATAIARGTKPEVTLNFFKTIILYCSKSAHSADFENQLSKCSESTQTFIKGIIESSASSAPPQPASKPPETPKATEKSTTEIKPQTSNSSLTAGEKAQLRIAEKKNIELKKELEQLQAELDSLQKPRNTTTVNSGSDNSQQKQDIAKMEKESKELDDGIKELDGVAKEKEKEQAEIRELNQQIQALEEKLKLPLDMEQLKQNEDPQIQELLKQIKEAEDQLKPEFAAKVKQDAEKLKETINKLKVSVASKKAKAGEVKEEPVDGETGKLEKEIDEMMNRNNQLNKEMLQLLSRSEAIEKSKQSKSFLEHLRTSDAFLSTH